MSDVASNLELVPCNWVQLMQTAPLASSEGLGWDAMAAYRFRFPDGPPLELPALRGYFLSVHLNGPCSLTGRWDGTTRRSRSVPGDIILLQCRQSVAWEWRGEFDEIQMILDPDRLDAAAREISDRRFTLREGIDIRDPFVSALSARVLEEIAAPEAGSRAFGQAMADTLIWHVLRRHSTLRESPALRRLDMPARKVRRALDYIASNLAEPLCVDDIAAAVGMSPFRFARGFKNATGQSPYQCLIARRIERAQELLRATDGTLADIARAVGFATQSQFTVAFRRRCQLTPARYRALQTN